MRTVVVLNQYGMGAPCAAPGLAPHDLQHRLLKSWLELALKDGPLPAAICVYTEGVRLVGPASPLLAELRAVEAAGVEILVCTTCLNYYGLAESLQAGAASCMSDIRARIDGADKVVAL